MEKRGHLYFILWVSGAGKGTIRAALKDDSDIEINFLRSYVTRAMRPWEIDGDVYYFISKGEFEDSIENEEFLEYEINHKTAYYGTKKSDVFLWLENNEIMIKEIDTKGLIQLKESHKDISDDYTSIFLDISNDVLKERFYERHPEACDADLQNRLESATFERKQAQEYCDYIVNASQRPEEVLNEIKKIIEA